MKGMMTFYMIFSSEFSAGEWDRICMWATEAVAFSLWSQCCERHLKSCRGFYTEQVEHWKHQCMLFHLTPPMCFNPASSSGKRAVNRVSMLIQPLVPLLSESSRMLTVVVFFPPRQKQKQKRLWQVLCCLHHVQAFTPVQTRWKTLQS